MFYSTLQSMCTSQGVVFLNVYVGSVHVYMLICIHFVGWHSFRPHTFDFHAHKLFGYCISCIMLCICFVLHFTILSFSNK